MAKWAKGDDYYERDADHKTFGITRLDPDHCNIIEVYGHKDLRDRLLWLLISDGRKERNHAI